MTGSSNGDSPDSTDGLERPYTPDVVERLRGPVKIEHMYGSSRSFAKARSASGSFSARATTSARSAR